MLIDIGHGLYARISPEDADITSLKWHAKPDGRTYYAQHSDRINGKTHCVRLHRIIMSRMLGRKLSPKEHVDHIDRDGLNCERGNLRLATCSQNKANNTGYRTKRGYLPGVRKQRNKYRARIRVNGRVESLGYFETPEAAHNAFKRRHREVHGEYSPYEETFE